MERGRVTKERTEERFLTALRYSLLPYWQNLPHVREAKNNRHLLSQPPLQLELMEGAFYKDCLPWLQREMRRNALPLLLESCPVRTWGFILLWSWGGTAANRLRMAEEEEGRSLTFHWHCWDAKLTMGLPTFGLLIIGDNTTFLLFKPPLCIVCSWKHPVLIPFTFLEKSLIANDWWGMVELTDRLGQLRLRGTFV